MDDRDFTQEDLDQNRTLAALGYLAFFVPLIWAKESKLGRYCANQGLILFVIGVLVNVLGSVLSRIPLIGWLFNVASGLIGFALLLVGLLCFAQLMTHDKAVELPYVGGFRLLPRKE